MTVEGYVRAIPKVDLNITFEGAVRKATWEFLADQNEVASALKTYEAIAAQLETPDYNKLDDLLPALADWVRYPDDITRLVYDMGVALSRQNVRYAEVNVTPGFYMKSNMGFDAFMEALNDGRDRVQRGWGVNLRWTLTVPRYEPRRADETVRWAAGASAKKHGIVGFNVAGREDLQPIGQFERAFHTAIRKFVPTSLRAGEIGGSESLVEAFEHLEINRLIDGWGTAESPEIIQKLIDEAIPLIITPSRALKLGLINSYKDYPLRQLLDAGVAVVLSADMPMLFHSELSDEYLAAVEHGGLSIDELDDVALNAVRFSNMPADEKANMLEEFEKTYSELQAEHLASTSQEETETNL